MKDRVPLYPGRVKLTPVSGKENTYDMVRADSPTQEGTPLNKATLLKDATAALFGLDENAVPDDAFAKIACEIQDHMVLLWENASPTSSFGAQTINVDCSNYDLFVCFFATYTNLDFIISTVAEKNAEHNINACTYNGSKLYSCWRAFTIKDHSILFGNGNVSGNTDKPSDMVPLKIYGLR